MWYIGRKCMNMSFLGIKNNKNSIPDTFSVS